MSTLYDRLVEIAKDDGYAAPRNKHIADLTGLSTGRVTQIKNEKESAKLSPDTLQRLLKRGYTFDWLQSGKGPKRWQQPDENNPYALSEKALDLHCVAEKSPQLPPTFTPVKTLRQRYIEQLIANLDLINDHGIAALLEKSKDLVKDYPAVNVQAS